MDPLKKALILIGSPKKNGNCAFAAKMIVIGLNDDITAENINVSTLNISPCSDCGYCLKHGRCKINDDMSFILQKINDADIIFVSSPLYFNSVSAQLKMVIDRCQVLWASKQIRSTPIINPNKARTGYFLCTAGSQKPDFTGAKLVMDLFFKAISSSFDDSILIDNTDEVPLNKRHDLSDIIESIIPYYHKNK